MSIAALMTLVVIISAFISMMMRWAKPEIALLSAVVILSSAGFLSTNVAFQGFSNSGTLTIAALFIVAAGIRETGAITKITSIIFGRPKSERSAVIRLIGPTLFASAFLNNTAIVATLLPVVNDWGKRIQISTSKLLMPLSFASILGGMCTLIGTSTNLVVAGLVDELIPYNDKLQPIGMFDITPVAIVAAFVGAIFLSILAPILLKTRKPPISSSDDPREYTIELLVPEGSSLAETSIEDAALRHLPGCFLMEVIRGEEIRSAVDGSLTLQEHDRLVFVGDVDAMIDLQQFPGLAAAPDQVFKLNGSRLNRQIMEAVISTRHPLLGLSIRESGFRSRYHAVVIAVARAGERVAGRIGDIIIQAGDVLLLEAPQDFILTQRNRSDFILVSHVEGAHPPRFERANIAAFILLTLVLALAFNILPPVTAAFLAAGGMILTRCCTLVEARQALDLSVLVTIASAFGLGGAIQETGLDLLIATQFIELGFSSPMWALIAIYGFTFLCTELITNSAAAVLTVPIALSLSEQVGANPMPFIFIIMISASASFLTPIGYQTNLMVMNAGGYHPTDYTKLGLPLSLAVGTVSLLLVPMFWAL